jgi:biopolymer transport protein ExbB
VDNGMGNVSLWELFRHGGPVMWPLLAASILGFAVVLERAVVFAYWYQSFGQVVVALRPLVTERAWSRAEQWCRRRGPFAHLAHVYLHHRNQPKEIREDVLRREGSLVLGHLETRLRWLAVLAQVSTLLGLLGTFYFMIYRFHPAATAGGQIQQSDFFAAIWDSFLSTMFGLAIAIPCSAAFQLFEGRVDAVSRQMSILVSYLDEWVRAGEGREAPGDGANGDGNQSPAKAEPLQESR